MVMFFVEVVDDRRKEPPNPREPIELPHVDVGQKEPGKHDADVANQSQQQAASPAISSTPKAQV